MIVIGSDHGGFKLKEEIKKYLDEKEIKYSDKGCFSEESVDYPNIAKEVAEDISNKKADVGILICRSGIGMSIVANKFKGVRCAVCYNEQIAKFSRMHNNANMMALGADYMSVNDAICIVRQFLATPFEGGRHEARVNLISEIEKENMK